MKKRTFTIIEKSDIRMTNQLNQVQINLTIHQDQEDVRVSFPFNTQSDDVDEVVKALINEIGLTDEEGVELKQVIESQLAFSRQSSSSSKISNSGITPIIVNPLDESDDADVANDREYQSLLEEQRKQLEEIERRHVQEQKELIEKLQRGTPLGATQNVDDLIIFG